MNRILPHAFAASLAGTRQFDKSNKTKELSQVQTPPAITVEFVALPGVGKSTSINRVSWKFSEAGLLVEVMNNNELALFHELKDLGCVVPLVPQARLVLYAALFIVQAYEMEGLRVRANVLLVEHHVAFFRCFELSRAVPDGARIAETALAGVRPADLTIYLRAPVSLAFERNERNLKKDFLVRMYRSLESLAIAEKWHVVSTVGRTEDDIATECFGLIFKRLKARFDAGAPLPEALCPTSK